MDEMSLPSSDRVNPREMARAAATKGQFHDVVVAASKALHNADLDERDIASLRWARELLDQAGSSDVLFAMPSAQQLAGPGAVVLALRRAAVPSGGDPEQGLRHLRQGLGGALKGRRDEGALEAMRALRDLFSAISRLSLTAELVRQSERTAGSSWALSATTSRL
jgi:hypothetical protein